MATNGHVGRRSNLLTAGVFSAVFGAVFVVVGLLGFTASGGPDAVGQTGGALLGLFQVNVLHNLAQLAVGAVMIAAAVAKIVLGAAYLALGLVGPVRRRRPSGQPHPAQRRGQRPAHRAPRGPARDRVGRESLRDRWLIVG